MKNITKFFRVTSICTGLLLAGCTNLDETVYDKVVAEKTILSASDLSSIMAPSFAQLRDVYWGWNGLFDVYEESSDLIVTPFRNGIGWGDLYITMHKHTWGTTLEHAEGLWYQCYTGVNYVNKAIYQIENLKGIDKPEIYINELRALRAIYYYLLYDNFRNVPIDTIFEHPEGFLPTQNTNQEVYAFIEKELTEAIPSLPAGKAYSRMTQDAATMLLAKLYLNAGVYKGSPEWQKAYDTIDKVIKSKNGYSLASSTVSNFIVQNQGSSENIWTIPFDSFKAGGMNFQMRTLHYANQQTYGLGNSPWNGFCTLADFYNSFEAKDLRQAMWIKGQQYAASGAALKDAKGNPLAFIADFQKDQMTDADPEFQVAGIRSQKYEIQRNNPNGDQSNDYVVFRLADAIMMRAEAAFRLGKTAEALADVNKIRVRSGVDALTSITAADILAERGREFAWEGWRRNDMIRFGVFSTPRKFMKVTDKSRELFPIPQPRIDANPLLKQNPGY